MYSSIKKEEEERLLLKVVADFKSDEYAMRFKRRRRRRNKNIGDTNKRCSSF